MLTNNQIKTIHSLRDEGRSKKAVAEKLGVSWSAVNNWWNKAQVAQLAEAIDLKSIKYRFESGLGYQNYAYVLGLYLGDGYINLQNKKYGVYKIRVFQDTKYPDLIKENAKALEQLLGNTAGTFKRKDANCVEVYCHSKELPILFPQIGKGVKHNRDVSLVDWQQEIVKQEPWYFIKGLIQTDGSIHIRRVGKYEYESINFTNKSKNIIDDLLWCCSLVNIQPTVFEREDGLITVTFSKRADVELIIENIGRK